MPILNEIVVCQFTAEQYIPSKIISDKCNQSFVIKCNQRFIHEIVIKADYAFSSAPIEEKNINYEFVILYVSKRISE